MRSTRPIRTFDLARVAAPAAPALLELHRRFLVEEERLTSALGTDDPPSFEDFVEWVVARAGRPPGRPRGSRDRHPDRAGARRRAAQLRRTDRQPRRPLEAVA